MLLDENRGVAIELALESPHKSNKTFIVISEDKLLSLFFFPPSTKISLSNIKSNYDICFFICQILVSYFNASHFYRTSLKRSFNRMLLKLNKGVLFEIQPK